MEVARNYQYLRFSEWDSQQLLSTDVSQISPNKSETTPSNTFKKNAVS